MRLKIISSGSAGNCLLLETPNEAIILDAGVPVIKPLRALGYNTERVKGLGVSHAHGDHAAHLREYIRRFFPEQITEATGFFYDGGQFTPGFYLSDRSEFKVFPFELSHDVRTLGFMLNSVRTGPVYYATDTGIFTTVPAGVSHFIIEANYSEALLERNVASGFLNPSLGDRIRKNHASIENALDLLANADLSAAKSVTLAHLSEANSDPDEFRRVVSEQTGLPCYIPGPGDELFL